MAKVVRVVVRLLPGEPDGDGGLALAIHEPAGDLTHRRAEDFARFSGSQKRAEELAPHLIELGLSA